MAKRTVPTDFFSGTLQGVTQVGQQLEQAQRRIAELEHLVADLHRQDKGAGEDGIVTLPLAAIVRDPQQVRRYFDPSKQSALVISIQELGIQEPLWVRPLGDEQYQLIAGERRYRAAQTLRLSDIPARIINVDADQALKLSLVENLQRDDPNPFEQTEAVIHLLQLELDLSQAEVVSLFQKKAYLDRLEALSDKDLGDFGDEVENVFHQRWQVLETLFASVVGQLTPESFRVSRLPLLKLPADIQAVLRQGQIEYTKARAIARVKEESDRQALLAEAIADNLSLSEIRNRIKVLKPAPVASLRTRFKEISSQMLKLPKDEWDDPKKAKKIAKLLEQLEGLVSPSEE